MNARNKRRKRIVLAILAFLCVGFFSIHVLPGLLFTRNGQYSTHLSPYYPAEKKIENKNYDVLYPLPDSYEDYGRRVVRETTLPENPEIETVSAETVYDRRARRLYFSCRDTYYYVYYGQKSGEWKDAFGARVYLDSERVYPDVYNLDTDQIEFTLRANAEGAFLKDDCLYYAYGTELPPLSVFDLNCLHGSFWPFQKVFFKDYRFARLNLDTGQTETLTKEEYESVVVSPCLNLNHPL